MTALVFNCDFNGLAIIQSLGRRGIDVRALDCTRSIGTHSRFAQYLPCPDPLVDEAGFIDFLLGQATASKERPVLFATNDHWLMAVSRHRDQLQQHYHCCAPTADTAELLLDKARFGRWAMLVGLTVPRSWGAEELYSINEEYFPLVAKPIVRRRSGNTSDGANKARSADRFRLRVCASQDELVAVLRSAAEAGVDCILQERVPGDSSDMRTIGLFAVDGDVKGVFSGRKVRGYPPEHGDCIVGESWQAPATLIDECVYAIRLLGFTGIAEFEFMHDRRKDVYRLIEINPRSWSWIGVTGASGVDLPWIAYSHFRREGNCGLGNGYNQVNRVEPERRTVRYAKVLQDLPNCLLWNSRAGRPDWRMTIRQWIDDYRGKKVVLAEFSRDDPRVAFFAIVAAGKMFLKRMFGR